MARLAPLEKENAQLKEQVEALRPDAEAHVMLRGQVGAIECEARQRAAELEAVSYTHLRFCDVDHALQRILRPNIVHVFLPVQHLSLIHI